MELKVPHVLSSADDPPLIGDVTILSSSTEEEKSAASARAIVPAETASVESWEVGDAVCWTKGDDELPNDAIGRVLRLHSGKCVLNHTLCAFFRSNQFSSSNL